MDGAEESLVELGLLVREALPDPFADRNAAVLQFDHGDSDTVEVEDQVRSALVATLEGDFFGDGKVVFRGIAPVDQMDGFGDFAGLGFDGHSVSEQFVDRFVVVVEAAMVVVGFLA